MKQLMVTGPPNSTWVGAEISTDKGSASVTPASAKEWQEVRLWPEGVESDCCNSRDKSRSSPLVESI